MSEETKNEQITEQDIKTLQQLKADREQHVKERERLEANLAQQEAELRKLQLESAVEKEFDTFSRNTGVKFHGRTADIFKLMHDQFDIKQSEDGSSVALLRKGSSDPIAFSDALESFAVEHSYWCLSLGTLRPEAERIQSRDDFHGNEEKARWISKHGLAAWEELPQHRVDRAHISSMTGAQYLAMPARQRLEIVTRYGESGVAAILKRR